MEHLLKNLDGSQFSEHSLHPAPYCQHTCFLQSLWRTLSSEKCNLHSVSERVATLIDLFTKFTGQSGDVDGEEEAVNAKLMSYYFSSYLCSSKLNVTGRWVTGRADEGSWDKMPRLLFTL